MPHSDHAIDAYVNQGEPMSDDLFGWKRIEVVGTCDACSENQALRYKWPETEAWLCAECWHEATEIDRLKAEVEPLRVALAAAKDDFSGAVFNCETLLMQRDTAEAELVAVRTALAGIRRERSAVEGPDDEPLCPHCYPTEATNER